MNNKKIIDSHLQTNCFYTAANTINKLQGYSLDISTLIDDLQCSAKNIHDEDTKEIEQLLMVQAKTLDCVFYDALSRLAEVNMVNQLEVFAGMAFKAQSQCRKTLAVLAELKNPRRTTFIKQQNNAITQQVNNGVQSKSQNSEKVTNELLSEAGYEALDYRGAKETGVINSAMAAMETINRSENG